MALSYKRINIDNMNFGRLQARGNYHFSASGYKGEPLVVDTPICITPTGIHAEEARNWMDIELDTANNKEHQILYDMFKNIDNRCIDESIEKKDKWFGKNVDEAYIEEQFKSPLTSGWGNEPALLRIEIVSEKPEDLVDSDGHVISPRDVTPLSQVALRLHLLGVWASEKFLGTHWRAIAVKAKLPDPNSRFRRSSSPRRIATPPDFNRNRRRHTHEPSSVQKDIAPFETDKKTESMPRKDVKSDESESRRNRVKEMLRQMKAQKSEAKQATQSPKVVVEKQGAPDDDDDRRYSDDDDHRRRSDYSDYSDYSDDDRRRRSDYSDDDDHRRRSDYSDYSDDDRRRYSDDDRHRHYSDRRRSYSDYSDYSDDDKYSKRR